MENYINRKIDSYLESWISDKNRKPLLLRGARQVGKTAIVRNLSKKFDNYVEINFESDIRAKAVFDNNLNPSEICENLSLLYNNTIKPGKTLLFFDEIQSCIPAISSLRFFYEKLPELHIISAGSLLEFALQDIPSFGVGRIKFLFVEPFSFDEFLMAAGANSLLSAKNNASVNKPLLEPIHELLLTHFKKFLILGGMPEVIANYIYSGDLNSSLAVLDDLINSYKTDFAKYKKRIPSLRISEVFDSVVRQSGEKFKFSKINSESNFKQLKEALDLLILAGLVIPVIHSSSNGIPLGAEIDYKKRKMLLFDTGIFLRLLGTDITDIMFNNNFNFINKGNLAELFVGVELHKSKLPFTKSDLYYWHRESPGSNAEVDYVIQLNEDIIPIEVKSAVKGSMRSIQRFIKEKNSKFGIRTSLENFSQYDNIKVLPLYSISSLYNPK